MRVAPRTQWIVGAGLALLTTLLLYHDRQQVLPHSLPGPIHVDRPSSPFEEALQAAGDAHWQAGQIVNADRAELEAWDPRATTPGASQGWRLQQLAADRGGHLRRARAAAQRAATLARTPDEAYRTARLRFLIEHEAGHHPQDLAQARLMMKLRPEDPESLTVLSRAAQCNGLKSPKSETLGKSGDAGI